MEVKLSQLELAELDPIRSKKFARSVKSESDPTQFLKKIKLIRPDPTREQITFNQIEIY
jgi:hypothetical protein